MTSHISIHGTCRFEDCRMNNYVMCILLLSFDTDAFGSDAYQKTGPHVRLAGARAPGPMRIANGMKDPSIS